MTFLNKNNSLKKSIISKIENILENESNKSGFKSISFFDFKKINDNFMKADNIVTGDTIGWVEAVFSGSFRNAKFSHFDFFYGKIIKESYGSEKAQHTFSIEKSDGSVVRKKGRTIFKEVCILLKSAENRHELQEEKNKRGDTAKINSLEKWLSENDLSHPRYEEKMSKLNYLTK